MGLNSFWAKSVESLENNGVDFYAVPKSAQEFEKKGDRPRIVGKFWDREVAG